MCRRVNAELEAALAAWAEANGVAIDIGGGTFDDGFYAPKIRINTIGENGIANTPERTDFERFASAFGLEPEWLDATFESRGTEYKIVGLKSRSRKYPIIGERADGKKFKFTADAVTVAMARAAL
jgi:hypothetical protein